MFFDYLDKTGLIKVSDKAKNLVNTTKTNLQILINTQISRINALETKINSLISGIDWKEAVATYADIATTYPNPEDGWTVNVKDTDYTYRYNGQSWVAISANSIPDATTSTKGLMTTTQVTKLNGLQPYTLPKADTLTLGGIKIDGITMTIDANGVVTAIGEDKSLAGLIDTSISEPLNDQVLKYDAGLRKWVNGESGALKIKLPDVSGANISVPLGSTTATITWTDPNNVVAEGIVLAEWAGTKVVRREGHAPSDVNDGTLIVDSKVKNQYASQGYTDTNLIYGRTYYYRFFPYTTGELYTEGTAISVVPKELVATVPTPSSTLTYNGNEQTMTFNDYDTDLMTATNISATNAGTYTAVFSLINGCEWRDGTTADKQVSWSIAKAIGGATLTPNSVLLDDNTYSANVVISDETGTILSVTSSSPSALSAVLNNHTITVEDLAEVSETYTVTISIDESTNYNAATKTLTVVATHSSVKIVTWQNGTDQEIADMLEAHYNGEINIYDYWTVGDTRTVSLSAMSAMSPLTDTHSAQNISYTLVNAGGKTLKTPINGHTECAFVVCMVNSALAVSGKMDTDNTNSGGWSSWARRTWCNTIFRNAHPTIIKNIFKEYLNKQTDGDGTVQTTYDYFAFPSLKETHNQTGQYPDGEADDVYFSYYNGYSFSNTFQMLRNAQNYGSYTYLTIDQGNIIGAFLNMETPIRTMGVI